MRLQQFASGIASCSGRSSLHPVPRSSPCLQSRPSARLRAQRGGGLGDEDGQLDMAVFRFTLGIPGFEDRLIPRVVGGLGATLLLVNHYLLAAQPLPDAQVRGEFVCLCLAIMCLLAPELEERLKEAQPGRGRQATAGSVQGATNGFALSPAVAEEAKAELAWASFALIKNTNTCGAILVGPRGALMARGAIGSSVLKAGDAGATLQGIAQDLSALREQPDVARLLAGAEAGGGPGGQGAPEALAAQQLYLPDTFALARAGAGRWGSIPAGAQSLLVQRVGGGGAGGPGGLLLVYSERPRALSGKERSWIATVASKLAPLMA